MLPKKKTVNDAFYSSLPLFRHFTRHLFLWHGNAVEEFPKHDLESHWWLASGAWWLYWCYRWLSSLPDSHVTFYTSVCLSACLPVFFLSRSHYDTWTETGNWCGYTCPPKPDVNRSMLLRCLTVLLLLNSHVDKVWKHSFPLMSLKIHIGGNHLSFKTHY